MVGGVGSVEGSPLGVGNVGVGVGVVWVGLSAMVMVILVPFPTLVFGKMLCLMTLVDVEAVSLDILTPWREELLWRLYVDTYNQLTLGYGDELIDNAQGGLATLLAQAPARRSSASPNGIPSSASARLSVRAVRW